MSETPHDELRWVSHPAARAPRRAAFTAAVILVCTAAAAWYAESVLVGAAAGLMMIAATSEFLFRTRHIVSDGRLSVVRPLFHRDYDLAKMRRAVLDREGFFLSPFPRAHRLDRSRGIYLRCGARRDEFLQTLRPLLAADCVVEQRS